MLGCFALLSDNRSLWDHFSSVAPIKTIRRRTSSEAWGNVKAQTPCVTQPAFNICSPYMASSLAATSSLRIANLIGQQRMTRNRCRQTTLQTPCQPNPSRIKDTRRGRRSPAFLFILRIRFFRLPIARIGLKAVGRPTRKDL